MLTFTRSGSRSLIQILLGLMLVLTLGTALASEKRGVGLWDRDRGAQLALLHASWYYTWSPIPCGIRCRLRPHGLGRSRSADPYSGTGW
jgi:hypothetical protein